MHRLFLLIFGVVFLMGAGCVTITPVAPQGGVFKSDNHGNTWIQKVFIKKVNDKDVTIGNASVTEMKFDPSDPKVMLLGTTANGGYITKNGGDNWEQFGPSTGPVDNFAINKKNNAEIYLSYNNLVFKTIDRGQAWNLIYTEPREIKISGLEVDSYDPKRIYISLEDGLLLRSVNSGFSWTVLKNFENKIEKFLIDPRDTRRIFVFTKDKGIFKSGDLGASWAQIKDVLEKYADGLKYRAAAFDLAKNNSLLYASKYGLFRSDDNGASWTPFSLLTQPGTVEILAVAADPKNSNRIYYTTKGKLYRTDDGGKSWIVIPIVPDMGGKFLESYPADTKILYMGMQKVVEPKKSLFMP